jgi:hypothetical protein
MWSDSGSPTIDQAITGGYPWLEIKCSRCRMPRDVDLCALLHVPTTCVHGLGRRLVCQKCKEAGGSARPRRSSSLRPASDMRPEPELCGASQLAKRRHDLLRAVGLGQKETAGR